MSNENQENKDNEVLESKGVESQTEKPSCCAHKKNKDLGEKSCSHHPHPHHALQSVDKEACRAHHHIDKATCEAHHKHHKHHQHHTHIDGKDPHAHLGDLHERARKMKKKRQIAKIGMVASLGVLTVTGFTRVLPFTKKAHAIAGIALLGFSAWHANLYKCPRHKKLHHGAEGYPKKCQAKKVATESAQNVCENEVKA